MADTKHITTNLAHQFGVAPGVLPSNHLLRSLALKGRKTIQALRDAWTKQIFCLLTLPCVIKTGSITFTGSECTFSYGTAELYAQNFSHSFRASLVHIPATASIPKWKNTLTAPIPTLWVVFFFSEATLKFLLSPSCSNAYHTRHLQM